MSDEKKTYSPLTQEDIDNITSKSKYPDAFKQFISDNFVGLDRMCSVSMGIEEYANVDDLFGKLNNKGLNIVRSDKDESMDLNKILVGKKGIETPLLPPDKALEMAVQIYDTLKDEDIARGFALPKTVESLCYSSPYTDSHINVSKELEINSKASELKAMLQEQNLTVDDFISKQIKEGMDYPEVNTAENTEKNFCKSLYRGGTLGSNPYAVVSSMKAKDCAYATPDMSLAKYYSSGLEAGYERAKVDGLNVEYGFIYEFEPKKDQRYFCNYGIENGENFSKSDKYSEENLEMLYETPVFAHQNPLKGIYLVANGKVVKITNDKGEFLSKDWENFVQLHETHVRKGSTNEKTFNEERISSILPKEGQATLKNTEKTLQQDNNIAITQGLIQGGYEKFIDQNADNNLRKLCENLQQIDPELRKQVIDDWNKQYYQKQPQTAEQGNEIAKDIMLQHKKELLPHIEKVFPEEIKKILSTEKTTEVKIERPMQTSELPPLPIEKRTDEKGTYEQFTEKDAHTKLTKICEELREKDPVLRQAVVQEWNKQYYQNPPTNVEQSDEIAKNVMTQYKKDLEPLVVNQVQNDLMYDRLTAQNADNNLRKLCENLQQIDPELRKQVIDDWNKQYYQKQPQTAEQGNEIAKDVMLQHKKELLPHIEKVFPEETQKILSTEKQFSVPQQPIKSNNESVATIESSQPTATMPTKDSKAMLLELSGRSGNGAKTVAVQEAPAPQKAQEQTAVVQPIKQDEQTATISQPLKPAALQEQKAVAQFSGQKIADLSSQQKATALTKMRVEADNPFSGEGFTAAKAALSPKTEVRTQTLQNAGAVPQMAFNATQKDSGMGSR